MFTGYSNLITPVECSIMSSSSNYKASHSHIMKYMTLLFCIDKLAEGCIICLSIEGESTVSIRVEVASILATSSLLPSLFALSQFLLRHCFGINIVRI